MTVNPGFGGQKLIRSMDKKISKLRKMIDEKNLEIEIQVDGGIKVENIGDVHSWGADIFVAGSEVFNSDDYTKTINDLKNNSKKG